MKVFEDIYAFIDGNEVMRIDLVTGGKITE